MPYGGVSFVLSGGGARAAYQVGVLRHIAQRVPDLSVPVITGVSAGAINAICLAAHRGDFREASAALTDAWLTLTTSRVFRTTPPSMAANALRWAGRLASGGTALAPRVRGLLDTSPLRRFLEGVVEPSGVREKIEAGRLRAFGVSATSYHTGLAVTWVEAAEQVPMWERAERRSLRVRVGIEHVMASSAIPLLFPAVRIDGEYFGDGSIRQAHPLAPAVHLGARRILAISSRYRRSGREAREPVVRGYPPPAQIIGLLFNSIFLDSLDTDSARLARVNHLLARIPAGKREDLALRPVDLLVLRPSRDLGKLAVGHEARLPRALRYLVRGLGVRGTRSADFLSYLLFEKAYLGELIHMGEQDAEREWKRIARFLEVPAGTGAAAPGLKRG